MASKNGDKRRAILAAALELFAENGFHGAPTSLIAQRAGIGVGTIYRYFKDKDELIHELHQEVHGRVLARICDGYDEGGSVRERFLFLFSRLLRLFLSEPKEFRFLEQYYYSPFAHRDELSSPPKEALMKRLLRLGRDQQLIRAAPMPVLEALAFGPLVALAKEHISGRLVVDDQMITLVVEAAWDGLKR
ncbi:MAG: TetR/AcrR family transcriptional regulator [Desulfuromonadales bacterium]|nr:TetR/AcrR family transcriptional regulator [Desulfuromonadales bacterium]